MDLVEEVPVAVSKRWTGAGVTWGNEKGDYFHLYTSLHYYKRRENISHIIPT